MDSLIVLANDQQKYSSITQTITLNSEDGASFQTISGPFSHQVDNTFKDFVVLGAENNSNENQLYFLVPSDHDKPVLNNQPSIILSPLSTHPQLYVNEGNRTENQISNDEKFPCKNVIKSFSNYQNSNSLSDISVTIQNSSLLENNLSEKLNLNSQKNLINNIPTLCDSREKISSAEVCIPNFPLAIGNTEERLSKRDSLISEQVCHQKPKKVFAPDKYKETVSSPSEYNNQKGLYFNTKSCYTCTLCEGNFKTKDELNFHEKETHGEVRPFHCPYCVNSFAKQNLLEYHVRRNHKGQKLYNCSFCEKKFFRTYDLKMHLNLHFGIKTSVCHICGKQFSHSSNLLRHLRIHTGVKPYLCKLCGQRFAQIPSLRAHLASHSSGGPCTECSANFRSIGALRKHIKLAHDKQISMKEAYRICNKNYPNEVSRLYYCTVCGEKFKFKRELILHEKESHSDGSFPCQSCFKVFQSIDHIKLHSCFVKKEENQKQNMRENINHPNYVCDSCLQSFSSLEASRCHTCNIKQKKDEYISICTEIEQSHSFTETIDEGDLDEDLLVLYLTSEKNGISYTVNRNHTRNQKELLIGEPSFDQLEDSLTVHNTRSTSKYDPQTFSNEPSMNIEENKLNKSKNFKGKNIFQKAKKPFNFPKIKLKEKTAIDMEESFKCPECRKTFSKKWNLQQHLGLHDASLRRYICNDCGLSFSYRSTYVKHLESHSLTTSTFTCSQCSKCYKHKYALNQHMKRKHEKQCNYACSLCSKGFFSKTEFSYHMRIHRKEYPYMCFACGKEFSHISHLHRHERIHTGEKPHKCPHCPKAFIQAVTLRIHLKKHEEIVGSNNKILDIISEEVDDGTVIQNISFSCQEGDDVTISLDSLTLPACDIKSSESEPFELLEKEEINVYPLRID